MVQLGALFGLDVVAEGIERPDQFALLGELGCEYGQGYLLGRPVPIEALAANASRVGGGAHTRV